MSDKQLDDIAKAVRNLLGKQATNNSAGGGGEKASSTGRNQSTPTPPKAQPNTSAQQQPAQQPQQAQQQPQQAAQQQQPAASAAQPQVQQQPAQQAQQQPQQPVQANAAQQQAPQYQPGSVGEQLQQQGIAPGSSEWERGIQDYHIARQAQGTEQQPQQQAQPDVQQPQQPVQANAAQAPEAQAPQEILNPVSGEQETLPEGSTVNPYTGEPLQPPTPTPEQQQGAGQQPQEPQSQQYSGSVAGKQAAANQNATLKNLSQANAFTTSTKNAISSFVTGADDKDAARTELQQRIDEFGDNPEKWNEWTAGQTKQQPQPNVPQPQAPQEVLNPNTGEQETLPEGAKVNPYTGEPLQDSTPAPEPQETTQTIMNPQTGEEEEVTGKFNPYTGTPLTNFTPEKVKERTDARDASIAAKNKTKTEEEGAKKKRKEPQWARDMKQEMAQDFSEVEGFSEDDADLMMTGSKEEKRAARQRYKAAVAEGTGGQSMSKSKASNFKKGRALIKAIDGLIQKQTPNSNANASAPKVATKTNTAASPNRTAANASDQVTTYGRGNKTLQAYQEAAQQPQPASTTPQVHPNYAAYEQEAAAAGISPEMTTTVEERKQQKRETASNWTTREGEKTEDPDKVQRNESQAWANRKRAESETDEGYQGLTAEEEAARKESFPVVSNNVINPATGEPFGVGTAEGQAKEAARQAAAAEKNRAFRENVVDPETGKTQRNISMNEKRGEVIERTEKLQDEEQSRLDALTERRAGRGYTKEEIEQKKKEAQEERLDKVESGEEEIAWKNMAAYARRLKQQKRTKREALEAAKLPRKTSAERKAEARESRMAKKAKQKEEEQTDQDRRVAHATQDAKIDYALQINAIDDETKKTLDNIFGRGAKAGTRNKIAAGVEQGRSKGRGVQNKVQTTRGKDITGEAGLTASHPKYRQEGSRDLVNRFIEQFGVGSLNTQQGQQWLEGIKDGVMYAPEDSELHGLRIPGQESFDASKKIWEKILQPRELEQMGIKTPALPAGKVAEEEEAVSPLSTSEQVEAGKEAGLEAKLTPSQKRAKAREELRAGVDTNVQFNTKINQKAAKRKKVQARRNAEQRKKLGISGRKEQPEPKEEPSVAVNRRNTSTEGTPQNTRMVHVPREEAVPEVEEEVTPLVTPPPVSQETLALPEGTKPKQKYSGSASGRQAATNQNAVLRNLSQTKTFTTATKNAISSFINDADDKNAARTELQQLIGDFQDNPEKWNEWTAEQTKDGYIKGTPVQQRTLRTEQNAVISNKLDTKTQSTIKDVLADAKEQGNEDKARNLIQTLLESFGDDVDKWAEWYKAYEAEGNQIGSYEAARNAASLGNRVFAASADNKITRLAKNIIGTFDDLFEALSPIPKVEEEIPASFFYKSVKNTDLVVNDKANHIVKGLDNFLEYTDRDKPLLRLNIFEKQERNASGRFTSGPSMSTVSERTDYDYRGGKRQALGKIGGHAGGPGWSGDHLVPMYRTVHRKIPRELILRAIRWVNPANFFKATTGQPITELSDDDWRAMDRDELIKNITTLNEYREESLVISNRYDQMMSLIEQGKTPYAVLWDDPDKWMTLDDRMDRAQDLKQGTANWEKQLDRTALRLRKILGEEKFNTEDGEKSHFGMIDELFDEDKGRIPFFKDISKRDKPWLRTTRGTGRFGEPEEARRVIADNAVAGIRAARYQIPSRRETLNPTIQEIRSDEFREIMLQAPIYQGIRMPTEEQLRSRDRLEITAEMIRQTASDYSRAEESPFLRTVNNPAGGWQEEAGVDSTMVRSTRFVAETLRLTRTAEEVEADRVYTERIQRLEHRTSTGASVADVLDPDKVPDEGQSVSAVEELERWFGSIGSLIGYRLEEEREEIGEEVAWVRSPQPRPPQTTNEATVQSVLKAFSIDREIGLDTAPAVSSYSHEGQQGYILENTLDVFSGGELTKEEFAGLLGKRAWRNSFYKMMLLDVMCGSSQGKSPNEQTRLLYAMGVRETGSRDNQWHGTNLEHMFKDRTSDGGMALFPYNIFDDDDFERKLKDRPMQQIDGFNAPKFGLQGSDEETTEIDYASEIQAEIEAALPRLDANKGNFVRRKSDEDNENLWGDLASRVASESMGDSSGRDSTQKYEELKKHIASWMMMYFDDPEGTALLTSDVAAPLNN